ncbi:Dynein light chain 2, cytoplasmic [Hymenolepis weldensis]
MSENMQQKAVDYAKEGMDQYGVEKEVASHVKKAFDRDFGPTWHCIVGRNFGSYVTHETNCFIYFYLRSIAVLLYKSECGNLVLFDFRLFMHELLIMICNYGKAGLPPEILEK